MKIRHLSAMFFGAAVAASALFALYNPPVREAHAQPAIQLPLGTAVNQHLNSVLGFGSLSPTVAGASCGTPVLTANSTDFAGEFQAKGTSTCKLTFGNAFVTKPFCVVQNQTTPASSAMTYDATGITMGTTVSNDFISYVCIGKVGG